MNSFSSYEPFEDPKNDDVLVNKPCECCPYGFHIDTDFVRYCDALLMALYNEHGSTGIDRSNSFRNYGSIERRFEFHEYLQRNHHQDVIIKSEIENNDYCNPEYDDHVSIHSVNSIDSSPSNKKSLSSNEAIDYEVESKTDSNKDDDSLSLSSLNANNPINVDIKQENEIGGETGSLPLSPTASSCLSSNVSKSVLTQIRNHLALSLFRVRELENQVSQVSILKEEIFKLKQERTDLLIQLNSMNLKNDKSSQLSNEDNDQNKTFKPIPDNCGQDQNHSNDSLNEFKIVECDSLNINPIEKSFRSVGTLTNFAPCLLFQNVFVQTDLKSNDIKNIVDTKDTTTMTMEEQSVSDSNAQRSFNEKGSQTESMEIFYQDKHLNNQTTLKIDDKDFDCYSIVEQKREDTVAIEDLLTNNDGNKSTTETNSSTTPTSSTQSIRLCEKCNEMIVSNNFDYNTTYCPSQHIATIPMPKITKTDSGISVERKQTDNKIMDIDNFILVYPSNDFENIPFLDENEYSSKDCCFKSCLNNKSMQQQVFIINGEIKGALKIINENLLGAFNYRKGSSLLLNKSTAVVKKNWFKISSSVDSDYRSVESYLDFVEKFSIKLLDFIVNLSDINGNTAIHYAISYCNFDIVGILLDTKICDLNKYNKAGYTAAMLVSLAKIENEVYRDIVERLFNQADVNLKAKQNGQTALMLAASHGRVEISKILLDCGAEVNLQDNDGSTALMCAAEHNHIEIISLLLSQPDCDPLIEDNEGSTALKIALVNGHNDIAVLLYAGSRDPCSKNFLNHRTSNPNHHRRSGSFSNSSLFQISSNNFKSHDIKSPTKLSRRSSFSSPSSKINFF